MPDKFVKSGQILGFKTGTQAAVNTLITNGGAVHGAFYLTQDTHRLYVGNEDTSLSPVNEGVVTVASLSGLPTPTTATEKIGLAGSFYYITAENILAVYNGNSWIRINQNTNDYLNSFEFEVDSTNNLIEGTIGDSGNHIAAAQFKVAAGDGVSVTYGTTSVTINGTATNVPTITVAADYSIGVITDTTDNNKVKVKLTSESGTNNDTAFEVKAGQDGAGNVNTTITNDSGALKITSRDTRNASVDVLGNATAGFDVEITDNYNNSVTTNFQPKIHYGQTTAATVDFINGTATLNVYSKGDIDSIMQGLNAMHYIGTYNLASSGTATAADTITVSGSGTTVSLGGVQKKMHIGDTILVAYTFTLGSGASAKTVNKNSLLIARGTEDANGEITDASLVFDIVESTADRDTVYRFVADDNNMGVMLTDSNNNTQGGIKFTGTADATGTVTNTGLIKVTKSYETDNNGQTATITIQHKDVARSNTTGTAVSSATASDGNGWLGSSTVNVITGITTNESGHITGVQTTSVTINDTNMHFAAGATTVTTTAHTGTNSKAVGVVKNTIEMVNAANATTSTDGYFALTSQSLTISDDDTQKISSTSNQSASGLNIEMVWGSF